MTEHMPHPDTGAAGERRRDDPLQLPYIPEGGPPPTTKPSGARNVFPWIAGAAVVAVVLYTKGDLVPHFASFQTPPAVVSYSELGKHRTVIDHDGYLQLARSRNDGVAKQQRVRIDPSSIDIITIPKAPISEPLIDRGSDETTITVTNQTGAVNHGSPTYAVSFRFTDEAGQSHSAALGINTLDPEVVRAGHRMEYPLSLP